MEASDLLIGELDRVKRAFTRTLDGLKPFELAWRPGPECNSIGLVIFHAARSEDMFVQARIQSKPQVYESGKWEDRMKVPAAVTGNSMTAEQICSFVVPDIADINAYSDAVRNATIEFIKSDAPDRFDRVIKMGPPFGDMTVGGLLALTILHTAQHAGEIAYLRGQQRGMNK